MKSNLVSSSKNLAAAVALVAFVAAGCTASTGDVEDAAPRAATPDDLVFAEEDPGEAAGLPAPTPIKSSESALPAFEFVATELETGGEVDGSYLFDRAPVVMTFVTPTCPICVSESFELSIAAIANPDITYVIVHSGATRDDYIEFLEAADLRGENIIHLDDSDDELLVRFRILSQPSSILLLPNGEVRSSAGALDAHGLERAAEMLSA